MYCFKFIVTINNRKDTNYYSNSQITKCFFCQKYYVRMIDTICFETMGICRTFAAENKS